MPPCLCGEKWYTETQRRRVFFFPHPSPLCLCASVVKIRVHRDAETQSFFLSHIPSPLCLRASVVEMKVHRDSETQSFFSSHTLLLCASVPLWWKGGTQSHRFFPPHKPLCASASLCKKIRFWPQFVRFRPQFPRFRPEFSPFRLQRYNISTSSASLNRREDRRKKTARATTYEGAPLKNA